MPVSAVVLLLVFAAVDGGLDGGLAPDGGAADAGGDAGVRLDLVAAPPPVVTVPLRGRVFARGSRDPLVGATVTIDARESAETGADGRFTWPVTPGRHRVQVQYPGHEPADVPVEVSATSAELTIRLMPRLTGERYETVVTRPSVEGDRVQLQEEELTRTPGSMGEPFRVLESLPGVTQVAWPLSIYAIRGANPGNTAFFLDGVRMPALFHFALGPAVIHPHFLEGFEFYPGGYPARFGRSVSGIVSATTAPPQPDRVRGSVDVRLFDAGGIIAIPINDGKGAVAIAGRYSYTGALFSLLSPDYTLQYWDYQLRADHKLGPGRATVFAFGSGDVLGNKLDPGANAEIHFHRLDLRWQGAVGPGRLAAATALGADQSAVALEQLVRLPIRASTRSVAPRVSYVLPGQRLDWELGADAEVQRFRPRSERADAMREDLFQNRVATQIGAHLSAIWRPTASVAITPGLRADAFFEEGQRTIEPEPRLSVRVRPFGETWFKAQIGRFAQMASLPVAVPGFEGFGLQKYGTQTSTQGSFGIEQPLGTALTIDATAFYQRLLLTDLKSMFNTDPQDPMILELRDGESYGLELLVRRPMSHRFYGWLAYTLSWSQRLVGSSRARAYSDWDQRHILNLVTGYRLRRGFGVGARFHLNTGRPYPVYDERNGQVDYIRLPTFYQLDLRADKRFYFEKYILEVYLELVNTTRTREVFDVKRRVDGRVDEIAYRIVLPSIGVHAEF